jgi:hypothetical protein
MEIQRGRGLVRHFLPAADEYSAAGVKPKVPQGGLGLVLDDISCARGLEAQAPVTELDEIYFEEPAMDVRVDR